MSAHTGNSCDWDPNCPDHGILSVAPPVCCRRAGDRPCLPSCVKVVGCCYPKNAVCPEHH